MQRLSDYAERLPRNDAKARYREKVDVIGGILVLLLLNSSKHARVLRLCTNMATSGKLRNFDHAMKFLYSRF